MSARWLRDSSNEAHVALTELFSDGTIEPTTQSKTIYDSNKKFQSFSLQVFRNMFNELNSEFGVLCKKIF